MIDPRTIEQFLARSLSNYDFVKDKSDKELDLEIALMKPAPDFGRVKLHRHQKACFILLNEMKRFLVFASMGGGKTIISLSLMRYLKQRGIKLRSLVMVPYVTSVGTWIDQVKEHTPDLICVPLMGTTKENRNLLKGRGDLFIICYQSAVAMLKEEVPRPENPRKSRWVLHRQRCNEYLSGVNVLILDESHRVKDQNSLAFQLCKLISSQADYVVGLTGTPFGKDLQDLWAQFYLIDFGETLGKTLSLYREVFFNRKINHWGGYEYTFRRGMLRNLKQIIKNASIRYELHEFADMPPLTPIIEWVDAPPDGVGYCEASLRELYNSKKLMGRDRYQAVESSYLKLRQLSSGFMTLKGEDSERLQLQFKSIPKLDKLIELIEGMGDEKVVVFHHFIYSNKMISAALTKLKIGHARVWGGQSDKLGELERFKNDPKCRVLVINSRSGSSSLNLQFARYMIFFESPDSPIDRQQAVARIYRPGQANRVIIYDLVARNTLDDGILRSCQAGKRLLDELLGGKK